MTWMGPWYTQVSFSVVSEPTIRKAGDRLSPDSQWIFIRSERTCGIPSAEYWLVVCVRDWEWDLREALGADADGAIVVCRKLHLL